MNEYEYEEVRGLPGTLPEGESILWQGAPSWRALARRTFHVRALSVYFAILVVAQGVAAVGLEGASVASAVTSALSVVPWALLAIAILVGLAWWHARTTVYTITDRRVVLRIGVAVQLAVNLPFREIGGAALMELPGGHGEIPLTLTGSGRIAYAHLWPHARPWRFKRPEPMLRCIPDAARVAALLTEAWQAEVEAHAAPSSEERSNAATGTPPRTDRPRAQSVGAPAGVT